MLNIICKFDCEFEKFLRKLFNYVTVHFGSDLNLSNLFTIEMVVELPNESDGRMIDEHIIHISSRLYKQLPTLDIDDLYENDIFKTIVKTLYHELCHINEIAIMPKIHEYGFSQEGVDYMVALFWIEYVVEKKGYSIYKLCNNELYNDVAKRKWKISKLNYEDADSSNFFYLIKLLPYVIARVQIDNIMDAYIKEINNPIVQSMVYELNNEVSQLEKLYPFDDIKTLQGINDIFAIHWDYFMRRKPFINTFSKKQ